MTSREVPTMNADLEKLEDGLRHSVEGHEESELEEFVRWLVDYVEKPLDRGLLRQAERRDLSVKTLLSLGHSTALTAVTGKLQEILRNRRL